MGSQLFTSYKPGVVEEMVISHALQPVPPAGEERVHHDQL